VRVAIYLRISTDEERQPFSLEAQQERLAAYVAVQPGWVLARSYSDRMSGKRLNRPALQQALHDARAARQYAETHFDIRHIGDQFEAILHGSNQVA
jgi:site-specific DNA recombinase